MKKRILSILLALCMICSLLPTSMATAAESTGHAQFEVSTWAELHEAVANGNKAILIANITNTSPVDGLVIPEGKTFTLDLNGYKLTRNQGSYSATGYVIKNSGKLTIMDGSPLKTGVITGGKSTANGGGIDNTGGTLTIKTGVTISGNTAKNGGGIYGGTVTTEDGVVIKNNTATANGGGIYIGTSDSVLRGEISGNQAVDGGAIWSLSSLSLRNIKIFDNTASGKGGAVCYSYSISLSSTVGLGMNQSDGESIEITKNKAGTGGAIYVYEPISSAGSKFYVYVGGKVIIKDNTNPSGVNPSNVYLSYYVRMRRSNPLTDDSEIHITTADSGFYVDRSGNALTELPHVVRDGSTAASSTAVFPVVYFGTGVGSTTPIAWYVLPATNLPSGNAYFLWSKGIVGNRSFDLADESQTESDTEFTWWVSDARAWLNGDFYQGAFSDAEKSAILKTKIATGTTVMNYEATGVDDYVFLLSADELISSKYGFINNLTNNANANAFALNVDRAKRCDTWYLMRTPYSAGPGWTNAVPGAIAVGGTFYPNGVDAAISTNFGMRPGINLSKDQVLFFAPAVNANQYKTNSKLTAPSSGEYKVALKDSDGFTVSNATLEDGQATFSYSGAVVDINRYITAVVVNKAGFTKYITNLAEAEESGTLTADLSDVILESGDKLYICSCKQSGDKKANYVSNLQEIRLPDIHSMKFVSGGASCTAVGIRQDCYYCTDCGKYFVDSIGSEELPNAEVAPTGHTWNDTYEIENADDANHHYVCTKCGAKDVGEAHDSLFGCSVCGKVANLWNWLQASVAQSGTIVLQRDVVCSETDDPICIDGVNVTIDLNGYTIDRNGQVDGSGEKGDVIRVTGGTLTLIDSSAKKTGTITGGTRGILATEGSTLNITDCTIKGNTFNGYGGGVCVYESNCTIDGTLFTENRAWQGGGIYLHHDDLDVCQMSITNCTFSKNHASADGGGINVGPSKPVITNCVMTENSADGKGGGIFVENHSSTTVLDCTITGNYITVAYHSSNGGGFYNDSPYTVVGGLMTITGNYTAVETNPDNLFLGDGGISMNEMKDGSRIGVRRSKSKYDSFYIVATPDNRKENYSKYLAMLIPDSSCQVLGGWLHDQNAIAFQNGYSCTYTGDYHAEGIYHYPVCSLCKNIDPETKEGHSGGTATCLEPAKCEKCGAGHGELGGHQGGTATCKDRAICDVCHEPYGALSTEHNWLPANCYRGEMCSVCEKTRGSVYHASVSEPLLHYSKELADETYHYPICCLLCGEFIKEFNYEEHVPGPEATTAGPQICKICGYEMAPALSSEVVFDNGGHGKELETLTVVGGNRIERPFISIVDGYKFDGWYKDPEYTTKWDFDVDVVTGPTTIYMKWTPKTYTVNFDAGEGSVSTKKMTVTFDSAYGALPTPTRTGYTFNGWFTEGGALITAETCVSIADNHTLSAQWSLNQFDVTFDACGGSVSTEKITVSYGSAYGELPTPTRSGYIFDGWFTAEEGGAKVTADQTVSLKANQTLYAHWTAEKFEIAVGDEAFDFGDVVHESSLEDKVFTIKNTGNMPTGDLRISLSGGNGAYTIDVTEISSLEAGEESEEITLAIADGLPIGAYTAQLTVTDGAGKFNKTCTVAMNVVYEITFDANGGKFKWNEPVVKKVLTDTDGDVFNYPTPTRDGYFFKEWTSDAEGNGDVITSAHFDSNTTLYAQWTLDHKHCICGAGHKEIGNHQVDVIEIYTPWTKTNALPTSSGYYYLTEDVVLTTAYKVNGGAINLCLNGHTITYAGASTVPVIELGASAFYVITDCHEEGAQGTITGGKYSGVRLYGNTSTTLLFFGGNITGNTVAGGTHKGGGGLYNWDGAVYLYGGKIYENDANGNNGGGVYNRSGTVTIYDVEITNNTGASGGGLYSYSGTVNFLGGSITKNTSTSYGGGVYMRSAATNSIGGNINITGNKHNGTTSNFYVTKVLSPVNLADDAKIGITINNWPTGTGKVNVAYAYAQSDVSHYFTDSKKYEIVYNNGYAAIIAKPVYDVGLATAEGAQIRLSEPQGLRFISTIDKTAVDFEKVVEFGTVLIPTADLDSIDDLEIGATLNGHAVAKVPAVNYLAQNDTSITFTAVITNIRPKNYKRSITVRTYAILDDGTVVYGETSTARSPYEVAENGLADENATDEEKEVFQEILDAAE